MGKIADAFDVTVGELGKWNPKSKRGVKQGQTIKVYSDVEYAAEDNSRSAKAQKGDNASKAKSKVTYRVKKGDTISSIARKYGVTASKLKSANSIKGSTLKSGQRLTIPQ
jgi:LysM repeat protein